MEIIEQTARQKNITNSPKQWGSPQKPEIPQAKIADFCHRWQIAEFALFGSILREDFRPDSDVDVLVKFSPATHWTLFDMVHMHDELKQIFKREVDLVSRRGLEFGRNPIRREAILSSAKVIYVA